MARARGGQSSLHNGQGRCENGNEVKEEPGWAHRTVSADVIEPHVVETTTPTGHVRRSRAPTPSGSDPRESLLEIRPGHWVRIT
ncbi:hypothetical protein BH11ACT8_BH11ACT8_07060 [soil metagenome]